MIYGILAACGREVDWGDIAVLVEMERRKRMLVLRQRLWHIAQNIFFDDLSVDGFEKMFEDGKAICEVFDAQGTSL